MSAGVETAIFYLSVAALAGGMMRAARASIERKARDQIGILIAAAGILGLIVVVVAFATGPRTLLPF